MGDISKGVGQHTLSRQKKNMFRIRMRKIRKFLCHSESDPEFCILKATQEERRIRIRNTTVRPFNCEKNVVIYIPERWRGRKISYHPHRDRRSWCSPQRTPPAWGRGGWSGWSDRPRGNVIRRQVAIQGWRSKNKKSLILISVAGVLIYEELNNLINFKSPGFGNDQHENAYY